MNHLNNSNISHSDYEELKKIYSSDELDEKIKLINNGYPVQYVIGNVNFYGNKILVDKNVLIPRFETEFLVDLILKKLSKSKNYKIADLGTGSGCIAISIAKEMPASYVTGYDISNEALSIANKNKKINNVNNCGFINNNILEFKDYNNYDVVVSNPPYVSFNEKVGYETKYEPQNAIFADNNGLIFYESILSNISKCIDKPRYIFFEIGMMQAADIKKLKEIYLPNYNIEVHKDLAGKDRYIYIYE